VVSCRFKVKFEVYDGSDQAVFELFDEDIEALIGKSCAEMYKDSKVGI
jgi:hypothetical protein